MTYHDKSMYGSRRKHQLQTESFIHRKGSNEGFIMKTKGMRVLVVGSGARNTCSGGQSEKALCREAFSVPRATEASPPSFATTWRRSTFGLVSGESSGKRVSILSLRIQILHLFCNLVQTVVDLTSAVVRSTIIAMQSKSSRTGGCQS